jgi:hypothetical protein
MAVPSGQQASAARPRPPQPSSDAFKQSWLRRAHSACSQWTASPEEALEIAIWLNDK